MSKWAAPRRFAIHFSLLALSCLPVCRGEACCAPSAQPLGAIEFLAIPLARAAQEQTPPNPQPQNPVPTTHKVKVWTTEELVAARTPADLYIFAKESQAAARQDEAFNNLMSCFAPDDTEGSAAETQKEIDATFQQIRDSEEAIAQSRKALRTAPENLKLRNQMELAQRTAELNHSREQLWKLQQHLQELQKSPPQETSPPAPQPSPN